MNWKTSILTFLMMVGAACVIPFVSTDEPKTNPVVVEQVVKPEPAPIVLQDGTNVTNIINRAMNPNTSWFSDSSNYIWDGWKIK